MAFLSSLDISGSALTTQRFRMDIVSENIANMNTTRTADGEPYRRRYTIIQEREPAAFSGMLDAAKGRYSSGSAGRGVRVTEVKEDEAPFQIKHDPTHPDADEDGYVQMPNVDLVTEMVDMMDAFRSYEANVTALNSIKDMSMKALNIGK